jgi:hypothetical protein
MYVMNAIKVEQNSDSETQSASSKDDFEFVAVKYEHDNLRTVLCPCVKNRGELNHFGFVL